MYVSPDFEEPVLQRLRALVDSLPPGTAELRLGEDPAANNKNIFPYFQIIPRNPRSAELRGYIYEPWGIDIAIGIASDEIFAGRRIESRKQAEDTLIWICQAVFTNPSTAKLTYSSGGKVIRSRLTVTMGSRTRKFRRQRIFWWLFPNRITKTIIYEPYYHNR